MPPIQLFQNFTVCQATAFPTVPLPDGTATEELAVLGPDPVASCEQLNALTAEALQAPLGSLKDLRIPLEDGLREAGGAPKAGDVQKLKMIVALEPYEKKLKEIEAAIQRPDAKLLCRQLRKEMVSAAEAGDPKALEGFDRKYEKLVSYAQAERKMVAVLGWAQARYPQNGRFTFELDFSSDNGRVGRFLETCRETGYCEELSALEPDIEYYRNLDLVQVYRELKDSGNEEDRAIADWAWEAISNHAFLTNNSLNSFFLGRQYEVTPSWESLDHMTGMIEATYGDPKLRSFLEKVEKREQESLASNEGYQTRMEFAKSVDVLEKFDAFSNVLNRPFSDVEKDIDQKMLTDYRELLKQRVASYGDFLESEEKRLQAEANNASGVPDATYDGTDFAPPPAEPTPELVAVRERLERVKAVRERLAENPEGLRADFEALAAVTPEIAEMENAHARGLVERLLSFLPETAPAAKRDLSEISSEQSYTYKELASVYRAVETDIRSRLVLAMVDGRIKQYEAFEDEEGLSEGIKDVLSAPFRLMTDEETFNEHRYPQGPAPEVTNADMIRAYREIHDQLASEDEEVRKEGLQAFQELEAISGHKMLYEAYQGDALFTGFTLGVGIVIAAAATGGLAATLAAPFLEGVTGGAILLTAIEGTVFTVTHKVLDSLVRGKNVADELFQFSTLAECGLNSLMFGFIKGAMGRYEKCFEKGLEVVARRNLAKSLGRAIGEQDAALVKAEMEALSEGAGVQVGKAVGGFVAEVGAFQSWGFFVEVGRRTLDKDPNAIESALKSTFSGEAILHSAQFLIGLKLGNVTATPLFGPVYQAADRWAMGKRIEMDLKKTDAAIAENYAQWVQALETRDSAKFKAAGEELLQNLADREAALEKVPEEYQNEHFKKVKDWHREIRNDIEAFVKSKKCLEEILAAGNGFGVKIQQSVDGWQGPSLTYDPAKKEDFRQALNQSLGGRNVKVLGSVIEATFKFPGGLEQTLVFTPASNVRQLPAAKRPAPKADDYDYNQMAAE